MIMMRGESCSEPELSGFPRVIATSRIIIHTNGWHCNNIFTRLVVCSGYVYFVGLCYSNYHEYIFLENVWYNWLCVNELKN